MSGNEVVLREQTEEDGFVTAEVYLSPLPGIEPMRVKARIGSLVRDILPKEARAPMVCIIDGIPLKREWWLERPVCEGDRIQFSPVFLGKGGGSGRILAAIAMIVVSYFAPYMVSTWGSAFATAPLAAGGTLTWLGHLAVAGIVMVGSALISAIIPPVSAGSTNQPDSPSSIYSVDTQGNAAKIFQPIPVMYGHMKYFPNYACQPYSEYMQTVPSFISPESTSSNTQVYPFQLKAGGNIVDPAHGQQYYYALLCIGQGEFDFNDGEDCGVYIADTPISTFSDIVCNILPPGTRPSLVNPCVVTSEMVSGQSLDDGSYKGPFPVCGPSRRTRTIGLDFVFPRGICRLNDKGKAEGASVKIFVQLQQINDAGQPIGGWVDGGSYNFSAASLTPQRRTIHIGVAQGRWQVRVARGNTRNTEDTRDCTEAQWAGLKAYLDEDAPLCKTATHIELVMRASEQLSSLSQRKISVICTRKIPSWDNDTPTATRSPLRALWDKWTNTVYGDGMPRDRIDVDALKHYEAVAEARNDRFDYVFESRISSRDADLLISKSFRAVALQRQGVKTVVRDELCDMPLTLFNPTNTAEKSVSLDYIQITEETTDGVIAEYFSNVSWNWEEVECPGPGRTYSNTSHPLYNPSLPVMTNPARITLDGITSRNHANREGLYYSYTNALRRQFISWTTELQGALVYYGAPVLFSSTLYHMQQGGEVRDWNIDTMLMQLTNGVHDGKIVFMRIDGTVTEPVGFTIVDESTGTIRLHSAPDAVINFGDYASERTKYVILEGEMIRRIVKILSVTPKGLSDNGAPMYELRGVVDVPEVHMVDEPFLVGDTPDIPVTPVDPIPMPKPDTPIIPDGPSYVVKLRDIARVPYCLTYEALYPNTGYPATIALYPDGALRTLYYDRAAAANPVMRGAIPGQEKVWNHWVEDAPIANVGSLYEAMFIGYWGAWDLFNSSSHKSPLGDFNAPSQEFLNNPNRFYMDGYKLYYTTSDWSGTSAQASDASTKNALNQVIMGFPIEVEGARTKHVVYTDWVSLERNVEFRGFWDTKPFAYPTGIPYINTYTTRYFAIAIRDKATHTVQSTKVYQLGFWRQGEYEAP